MEKKEAVQTKPPATNPPPSSKDNKFSKSNSPKTPYQLSPTPGPTKDKK
jgi:hypothetical protein